MAVLQSAEDVIHRGYRRKGERMTFEELEA